MLGVVSTPPQYLTDVYDSGPANILLVCTEGTDLFGNLPRVSEILLFVQTIFAYGAVHPK